MDRVSMKPFAATLLMALFLSGCGLAAQYEAKRQHEAFEAAFKEAERIALECRDKRLRGELSGYVASVRCSNDRMRQVIAASGWPHMDLEHLMLAYRAAVARRQDEGTISEEEANAMLAELNVRRMTEINRRNAMAHQMYIQEQQAYSQRMQGMGAYLQGLGVWQQSVTPPAPVTRGPITCYQSGNMIQCN